MKSYKNYKTSDFILDKSFVKWINKPTAEQDHFWQEVIQQNPELEEEIKLAAFIVRKSRPDRLDLSGEEVNELWNSIHSSTIAIRKKYRRLRYISIAAGFMLLATIGTWYFLSENKKEIVIDYAGVKVTANSDNEVKLVLADQSVVHITEKDSRLRYDKSGKLYMNSRQVSTGKSIEESSTGKEEVQFNQIIVPNGKHSNIVFSDGTKIWLNSGSRAIYPAKFLPSRREIYIEGEAFLEVTQNKSAPFIAKTEKLDVQVLGTIFNIKAYQDAQNVSVVLVEGSVKVKSQNKELAKMSPNQLFTYSQSNGSSSLQKNIDVNEYIGWKDGWILCNSRSLSSIITELSRYYNRKILIDDEKATLYKLSGKLDLKEDLKVVLNIISETAPVNYRNEGGVIHITNK